MIGPDGKFLSYPTWLAREQRRERWRAFWGGFAGVMLVAVCACLLAGGAFLIATAP